MTDEPLNRAGAPYHPEYDIASESFGIFQPSSFVLGAGEQGPVEGSLPPFKRNEFAIRWMVPPWPWEMADRPFGRYAPRVSTAGAFIDSLPARRKRLKAAIHDLRGRTIDAWAVLKGSESICDCDPDGW